MASRTLYLVIAVVVVVLAIVAAILAAGGGAATPTTPRATTPTPATTPTAPPTKKTIKIGVLAGITGPNPTIGIGGRDAILLAVDDANAMCPAVQFQAVVQDTAYDPQKALERVQNLYAQGVRITVGPTISAEVATIMNFVKNTGMLHMSSYSTSPLLAIPDRGYIYRNVPNDLEQAKAQAALLAKLGVKKIVIVYRKDAWGEGLSKALTDEAQRRGITVVASEGYDPTPAAYAVGVPAALSRLSQALGTASPEAALVFVTFEEDGLVAVRSAAQDPVLSKVRWTGGDALANSEVLARQAGDMAARAKFMVTVTAPDPRDPKYREFINRYQNIYKRSPTAYDPYSYDAAMMLMSIMCQLGTDDPEKVNAVLRQWGESGTYSGVTGKVFFSKYGDRASANYAILGIKIVNATAQWVNAAYFHGDTGEIEVFDQAFFQ